MSGAASIGSIAGGIATEAAASNSASSACPPSTVTPVCSAVAQCSYRPSAQYWHVPHHACA